MQSNAPVSCRCQSSSTAPEDEIIHCNDALIDNKKFFNLSFSKYFEIDIQLNLFYFAISTVWFSSSY